MKIKTILAAGAMSVAAIAANNAHAGAVLDGIKAKGFVQCGVNTGLPGFSAANAEGKWEGIDVDICRGIAAALLGDANKVQYTPLTAAQRFTALQSGEIDILSRNTTATLTRDVKLGLTFLGINYYDGQGFLIPKALGVSSATELDGATVCVEPGTTTELNLADYFRAKGMSFEPVVIENINEATAAFFSGRCDVYTTDASGLASIRTTMAPKPDDYAILPEIISKEPLGPVVAQGDEQWADIGRWALFAMLEAEEFGVTSANVDEMKSTTNPGIQRLLGVSPGMGEALGLDEEWAYRIIKQVGNYGESYEKNVTAKLGVERGLNALWTNGGLQYAWPVR
ncbi:amino acid ABC transporter substrate-binding protein [Thalassospira alkalitolerans]|uniref:Amino acid ABC transporter substrate-binding protein n=1 Tax=Thalassospira alkalitolerans TaxID=1293890 RepID=A0A1Y2L6W4_9PROT|nr:amino acid ABC transporter substrate-binding protein [Thalassospira alkalitolerans]OSQ43021.1 amino acid ABC transporter substrate-binding protein [Thalassospira alkalitolerans]